MAHNPDSDQHKRKRDISDDNGSQAPHADRIPQPPPPQSGMSHTHHANAHAYPRPSSRIYTLHTYTTPTPPMGHSHMEHDSAGGVLLSCFICNTSFFPSWCSCCARHKYHKSQIILCSLFLCPRYLIRYFSQMSNELFSITIWVRPHQKSVLANQFFKAT